MELRFGDASNERIWTPGADCGDRAAVTEGALQKRHIEDRAKSPSNTDSGSLGVPLR
jgi:hypothetical protein